MSIFNLTKQPDDFVVGYSNPAAKGMRGSTSRHAAQLARAAEVWHPEYLNTIQECAAMGATGDEIATCLGIRMYVLKKWVRERYDVQRALAAGIHRANMNVRKALYMRAVGYSHPETKTHYDPESGEWAQLDVTKHYPPDTKALEIWLRNRDPGKWDAATGDPSSATFIQNNVQNNNIINTTQSQPEVAAAYKRLIGGG